MRHLSIHNDLSLEEHYNIPKLPVSVHLDHLSDFGSQILPHWNDSFELVSIVSGQMQILIHAQKIILRPGDVMAINVGRTHQLSSIDGGDCEFIAILASPKIFVTDMSVASEMMSALLDDAHPGYILMQEDTLDRRTILRMVNRMLELYQDRIPGYPLAVVGYLHLILSMLYRLGQPGSETTTSRTQPDEKILRSMIAYIHLHFSGVISLDAIAEAGSVSRSKCCALFRKYLHQSPIEFANDYRLDVSKLYLHSNPSLSIAEVAAQCGFTQQSYYTKLFVRHYGMTPREYRRQSGNDNSPAPAAPQATSELMEENPEMQMGKTSGSRYNSRNEAAAHRVIDTLNEIAAGAEIPDSLHPGNGSMWL